MNKTDEEKLWEWNNELARIYIVNDIFLVIYLILGMFGNATVVAVSSFKMRSKTDDRFFIPYLAVVDFLACTTRSSFELAMNLLPVNFRGSILCKILWFPTNVTSFSSMFLLLTISLQRYLKVCRPFGRQMNMRWKKVALGITLFLSVALSMPLNIWNEEIPVRNEKLNITGYMCDAKLEGNLGPAFIIFVVCITVLALIIMLGMIIFNTLIARTIYIQLKLERKRIEQVELTRHRQAISTKRSIIPAHVSESEDVTPSLSMNEESSTDITTGSKTDKVNKNITPKQKEKKERKRMLLSHRYSYMFMVIALAFMLSYLPQFILLFVGIGDTNFWVKRTNTELTVFSLIREMNVINNSVNPCVYGFFDRRVRQETMKVFRSMKCW